MIKEQKVTEKYAIYNSDCMYVIPTLPDNSVDLSIYSPPFAGLYNYSSSPNDFSNCESKDEFLKQYEFLISHIARVTKPGRMSLVHCQHIPEKGNKLWHFPSKILEIHEKYNLEFFDERYIWKEPLKVAIRTRAQGLMHKWIVEDSTKCRSALGDILMIFRKKGENQVPVTHEQGFKKYYGSNPLPEYLRENYGSWEHIEQKYKHHLEPKTNKMSHIIWQRYASVFWDDIRLNNVLPYKEAKEADDEKHVHPLQLDVIARIVDLYSNPNEVVLTPFMGVGSEVYQSVKMGRKGIGIELKESYFNQAIKHLENIEHEQEESQLTLF